MRARMPNNKRPPTNILLEDTGFAPTAAEEAAKVNSQVSGMTLQTDQSYWEEYGISTGEELALSLLSSSYSDMYKSIHGIRPRWQEFSSPAEAQAAIDALNQEVEAMIAADELRVQQQAEYEKKEKELQALMPGEFDFEHVPRRSGMGRRTESTSKLRITLNDLEDIISEHMDGHPFPGSLEDLAQCHGKFWGHGSVVDPSGWKDSVKMGSLYTQGKARSPLRSKRVKITERQLRKLIRETCALGHEEPEPMAAMPLELSIPTAPEATAAPSPEVPVPEDYDAVRDFLEQNPELVDLGLSIVMEMAGTSCERSTAQGIIDHLQGMLDSGEVGEEEISMIDPGVVELPGEDIFGIDM